MSVLGLSSYFLWTQKGKTVLPLVRGSGFVLQFKQLSTFYQYHIVTAAHVSCPVRYRQIYGNTVGLKGIGERHVSTRLLTPDMATGRVASSLEMEFRQHFMPNVDVACLRCKQEVDIASNNVQPFVVDTDPIEEGEQLIFCGVEATEERANPNDDGLHLKEARIVGCCRAAMVTLDFGTVLLATLGDESTKPEHGVSTAPLLPLSMCGGPVLRPRSGGCVGVIVARVMKNAPPRDPSVNALYQDPYLDISENTDIDRGWQLDAAFVPIGEFYSAMRRSEM